MAYSAIVAASIARSGDMGGPLNFVLVPAAGLVVGVAVAGLLLLLSPLFHKATRIALVAPFAIALLSFLVLLIWSYSRGSSGAFPVALSAFVAFWFGSAALLFILIDLAMRHFAQALTERRAVADKL